MIVRNKKEMYDLYFAGEFGNKLATWESLAECLAANYDGPVTIRYRVEGSKFCRFDIPKPEVQAQVEAWVKDGARVDLMTFNETIDTSKIVFQGEVQRDIFHYSLRYSLAQTHMRPALADAPLHAFGLRAVSILRYYLDPSSYADLEVLFDKYPDSVVEMTTVRGNIGSIASRNTVFWEVRNY